MGKGSLGMRKNSPLTSVLFKKKKKKLTDTRIHAGIVLIYDLIIKI